MFKYLILICLTFAFVHSAPKFVDSFKDAFEFEINHYDFDANHENDLELFKSFKSQFNKAYETDQEEQRRFKIFRTNLLKIKLLNAFEKGTAVYRTNKFSDLSESEFIFKYTGLNTKRNFTDRFSEPEFNINELPKEVDWRKKGAVTGVKNQGTCGSCWAFSTVAAIESHNKIANGELISLSEQELVDCELESSGCVGGFVDKAFDYVKSGGLEKEDVYPYTGIWIYGKCNFNKSLAVVKIKDFKILDKNEDVIAKYVAEGPVTVNLNAEYMQFYYGGIADPGPGCEPYYLNHSVTVVGYGEDKESGLKFWIIKNSWGDSWGESGYYYLSRGKNSCGVQEFSISPVV